MGSFILFDVWLSKRITPLSNEVNCLCFDEFIMKIFLLFPFQGAKQTTSNLSDETRHLILLL